MPGAVKVQGNGGISTSRTHTFGLACVTAKACSLDHSDSHTYGSCTVHDIATVLESEASEMTSSGGRLTVRSGPSADDRALKDLRDFRDRLRQRQRNRGLAPFPAQQLGLGIPYAAERGVFN
jgi:hypothetical protein